MQLLLLLLLAMPAAAAAAAAAAVAAPTITCPQGFQQDGAECSDVNECNMIFYSGELQFDMCNNSLIHPRGHQCINTVGSFWCRRIADCSFGYRQNVSSGECVDINECETLGAKACGTGPPKKFCVNKPGTFTCEYRRCGRGLHLDRRTGNCTQCPRGYATNSRGKCEDVNECVSATLNLCPPHMRCVNYKGTYECKHKIFCSVGFKHNFNGSECVDVNECEQRIDACYFGYECVNTIGSYVCKPRKCLQRQTFNAITGECDCNSGFHYSAEAKRCVDVDECKLGLDSCNATEACWNSRGGYDCIPLNRVCRPGLAWDFTAFRCVDIDECDFGSYKCEANQYCVNTFGSYQCECIDGYRKNGSLCYDINECQQPNICPKNFKCHNSPGNYSCSCDSGFQLTEDGCIDVNECAMDAGVCKPGKCSNTVGSYECSCPLGFIPHGKAPVCADVNECNDKKYCGEKVCHNTPGSYYCECGRGIRWNNVTNVCTDINECNLQPNCSSKETCFNYEGGHFCYEINCPSGFTNDLKSITKSYVYFRCKSKGDTCNRMLISSNWYCINKWNYKELPSSYSNSSQCKLKISSVQRRQFINSTLTSVTLLTNSGIEQQIDNPNNNPIIQAMLPELKSGYTKSDYCIDTDELQKSITKVIAEVVVSKINGEEFFRTVNHITLD